MYGMPSLIVLTSKRQAEEYARSTGKNHLGEYAKPQLSEIIEFLSQWSNHLLELSRTFPEFASLGFFLRRNSMLKIHREAHNRIPESCIGRPRGVVLHIPPANVDTVFAYTLGLSLLMGNTNIVRISSRAGLATSKLVESIEHVLRAHPVIQPMINFVSFGHDPDVLEALSKSADIRMLWGGNESIRALKSCEGGFFTRDLAFPDRESVALFDVNALDELGDDELSMLAHRFYNDVYWFDQMACSSPREVYFLGQPDLAVRTAARFFSQLSFIANSRREMQEGNLIDKMMATVVGAVMNDAQSSWISGNVVYSWLPIMGSICPDPVVGTLFAPSSGVWMISHAECTEQLRPFRILVLPP